MTLAYDTIFPMLFANKAVPTVLLTTRAAFSSQTLLVSYYCTEKGSDFYDGAHCLNSRFDTMKILLVSED